jgi:Rieske Fe-S protein
MNPYVRPTDPVPISRRSAIRNAGLAAVALTGLASCSNYSAQSPATSAPAGSAPAGGAGLTSPTADIPVGGGKIFSDAATVITQPTKGEFKAFSSICTHASCPVAAVTTTIDCNCHGSKFALADGAVVNGPATSPLPAKTVKVDGDSVVVSA